MKLRVEKTVFDKVIPLIRLGKKERVTFDNPSGSSWWIAIDDDIDQVVGCVCSVEKGNITRFKSDFVLREYRGKGVYKILFSERLLETKSLKITAFCTHFSLPTYLNNGFAPVSKNRDITFVELLRSK